MTLTEKDFYYLDRIKIDNLVTWIYDKLSSNEEKIIDHELYSGKLGLVLYYFYYSQIQNKIIDEDIKLLDEILDNISTLNIKAIDDIFLFSHLGLVIQTLLDEDSSKFSQYKSLLLDIDKILFPYMEYWVNNSNFEFLRGGTNIALYYSLRKRAKYVSIYIDGLYKKIDEYILSNANLNYGIAHGISGIILYLVNFPLTCQRNEVTKIKEICTKCINRLLDANNPNNGDISLFRRDEITRTYDTKLDWCQGDLSIGYMLSKVYTQFPDIVPVEKLNYILDRTLVRSSNENIADFCLCHGAIGISLLYYLQYKERTSENYLSMFTYWLKRAIELYQSGVRNPIYKEYGLGLGLLLGEVDIGLYLIGHFFSNRKEL